MHETDFPLKIDYIRRNTTEGYLVDMLPLTTLPLTTRSTITTGLYLKHLENKNRSFSNGENKN